MAEHHSLLGADKPTRGILSRAKKSVNYLPRLGGEPNSKLIVSFLRVWRGAERGVRGGEPEIMLILKMFPRHQLKGIDLVDFMLWGICIIY